MREYVEIKLNEPPLLINQSSKKIRDKSRKKKQKRTEIRLPCATIVYPNFVEIVRTKSFAYSNWRENDAKQQPIFDVFVPKLKQMVRGLEEGFIKQPKERTN